MYLASLSDLSEWAIKEIAEFQGEISVLCQWRKGGYRYKLVYIISISSEIIFDYEKIISSFHEAKT